MILQCYHDYLKPSRRKRKQNNQTYYRKVCYKKSFEKLIKQIMVISNDYNYNLEIKEKKIAGKPKLKKGKNDKINKAKSLIDKDEVNSSFDSSFDVSFDEILNFNTMIKTNNYKNDKDLMDSIFGSDNESGIFNHSDNKEINNIITNEVRNISNFDGACSNNKNLGFPIIQDNDKDDDKLNYDANKNIFEIPSTNNNNNIEDDYIEIIASLQMKIKSLEDQNNLLKTKVLTTPKSTKRAIRFEYIILLLYILYYY